MTEKVTFFEDVEEWDTPAAEPMHRARPAHLPPTPEEVGRAAMWCYRDEDTDEEIARRLGICRRTLVRWKLRPEFVAATTALDAYVDLEARRDMLRWGLKSWYP